MRTYVAGIFFTLAIGCAASRPAHEPAPRAPSPSPALEPVASAPASVSTSPDRRECPAENPATRVIAQEVDGGAALVFTAPEDTAALRRRVVELPLPTDTQRADLSSDNIRNGIRLVFKTTESASVSELRDTLDRYAEQLADRCGLTLAPPKEPKSAPAKKAETAKKHPAKVETSSKLVLPPHKTTPPAKPPAPPKPATKPVAKSKPSESTNPQRAPTKPPTSLTNAPTRARPGLPRQRGGNPNRWRTRRFASSSLAALLPAR